jgi:hypothetical protein
MMQPKGIEGATQKLDATPTEIHNSWLSLVARYAEMDISVPGDYLIAIAALAEEYHSRNPALGRYLAGHWAGHLQYSLDWIVAYPCHEMGTYRAPSWSWASVQGGWPFLYNNFTKGEPQIEILECATSLAELTLPFGAVTNGYLKIRARLAQVGWRRLGEHHASVYYITNQKVNKEEEVKNKTEPHEIAKAYPDTIENFPPPDNGAATNETVSLMDLYTHTSANLMVVSLVLRKCGENTFDRWAASGKTFKIMAPPTLLTRGCFILFDQFHNAEWKEQDNREDAAIHRKRNYEEQEQ